MYYPNLNKFYFVLKSYTKYFKEDLETNQFQQLIL